MRRACAVWALAAVDRHACQPSHCPFLPLASSSAVAGMRHADIFSRGSPACCDLGPRIGETRIEEVRLWLRLMTVLKPMSFLADPC